MKYLFCNSFRPHFLHLTSSHLQVRQHLAFRSAPWFRRLPQFSDVPASLSLFGLALPLIPFGLDSFTSDVRKTILSKLRSRTKMMQLHSYSNFGHPLSLYLQLTPKCLRQLSPLATATAPRPRQGKPQFFRYHLRVGEM